MYEGTVLICAHCGMSFEQTTTHPRTYCSDACARAGRNKALKELWDGRKGGGFDVAREIFIFSSSDGYRREASPDLGF